MPVGFNSPARNLFLLGSTGSQVVGNFFKTIDKSAGTDGVYAPDEIVYNVIDQKYFLAGTAADSNSRTFGWFEKRDEAGTADFDFTLQSSLATENTTLRAMELDVNNNLVVAGIAGSVPWIAKSDNNGAIQWFATTNTADVRYLGLASDSNGNYYACGRTSLTASDTQAFVEKFDGNGNPGWGKQGYMLGRDVVLKSIDVNDRGEAVAVGYLEDDSNYKGYIIKINANTGDVMWDRTLSTDDTILCTDCYIDSKDQIYVTVTGTTDSYLVKYTPEGNIEWQRKTAQTGASISYKQVSSDGETGQTITFGTYDDGSDVVGLLSKYSRNGDLVFRRKLQSSFNNSDTFSSLSLYSDPSFYYLLYVDSPVSGLNGTPDKYTYGKVSSSGNGLGAFQYTEGTGVTLDYEIIPAPDEIGRLSDGSVRNDTSDLITYPFSANNILFDDLSTQVTNKKRQMDGPGSFQYSGSPAIRVADFQKVNLLGDVYSGSGDWLDQSINGIDATTSLTTTAEEPFSGAGSVEFDGNDYLEIADNPNWDQPGDFTIEYWVYFNDVSGSIVPVGRDTGYITLQSVNGRVRIVRYAQALLTETSFYPSVNTWYHFALVRSGSGSNNVKAYVDGVEVGQVTDTTSTQLANPLNIGRNGSTYTDYLNGYLSNVRIINGTALYTGNFTPPTSALTNTGQTAGTDYYTGSEWTSGINAPEDAFTASTAGSGGNGGNFGPFTYTFATPVTGVTSARIRGALGASVGQVGGTTNVILVDGQDVTQKFKNAGLYTTVGWVDVTAEVGGTWNSFRVQGISGSTNPNVSGVEVNGVQLISSGTTGTVLLTAQGSSITDASDSNVSITVNGDAAASVGGTNTVAYNAAGGYFDLDGVDDNLVISRNDFTSSGNINFSIESWFYFDSLTTRPTSKGYIWDQSPGAGGVAFRASTAGDLTTFAYPTGGGGVVLTNSGVAIQTGRWYHAVSVFETDKVSLYVDGVLANATTNATIASVADVGNTDFFIGSAADGGTGNGSEFMDGRIGEFRIYDRVLTPAAVQQNFNASQYKYTNVRPNTTPFFTSNPILINNNLLLNYDFGSGACIQKSSNIAPGSQEIILDDAVDNGAAFGDQECVAVGYGKVVVGARGEDNGSYVNGGKAYVYNATTGALEVTLTPSNIAGNDMLFGNAVDIDDVTGRIAVTTPSSIYLYDADGSNEVIIDSNTTLPISPPGGLSFGTSVAISGNRVWTADDNVPTGPNYNGTVYCFDAETGAFIYQLRPKYELDNFYNYGHFLAAGEGKLAVGSGSITHSVTGRAVTGKVYLYDVDGSNEKVIEPLNLTTSSGFGELSDLDIGYGMIVIGATRQQRTEDPQKIGSGEVFVFDTEGNFKFSIRPSDDPANEDANAMGFGGSVAISSDRIAVGARYYIGNPGGVAGRAYLFDHSGKELQAWIPPTSPIVYASDFGSAMDAAGGTLAIGASGGSPDASGRVYIYPVTGTTTGKVLNLANPSAYTGTVNGATFNSAGYFDLDGTNDYISLGTQSFITTQHSVEMWLNVSAAKEHYLFSFGYFDNTSALFYLDTNAQELVVTWRVGGTNQSPVQSGVYFTTNQWRHVMWTRNGATNKIYVNGVEEASSTTQTTASLPACIYDIGWATTRSKPTAYTQGEIGEVRIYNDALTASEVLQNFNATRGKYGV